MKAFFSQKKKAILARTIVLGLCLVTPWNRAEAVSSYTTPNGLIRLDYYGTGESFTVNNDIITSQSTLPDWQKERINFVADYWDGLLKHTTTARQPAVLAVTSDDTFNNASATSYSYGMMEDGKPVFVTCPNAVLNHGMILTAEGEPASVLKIGTVAFPINGSRW